MDMSVPAGAAKLLDLIASVEAPQGYGTIYGNNQRKLPHPITSMMLDEVIAAQPSWTKAYGSSACGRYQFMRNTLLGLKAELKLTGREVFDEGLQDRLGFRLLKRRGYDKFMAGQISATQFALGIAQEWASFPSLTACAGAHRPISRGQSYYAGDGVNKCLMAPDRVEACLREVKATDSAVQIAAAPPPSRIVELPAAQVAPKQPGFWDRFLAGFKSASKGA